MKAVIMAGGLGTRLKAVSGNRPKPLVPLLGKPLMEHIIVLLREQGFTEICAAVSYKAGEIMACFGDGSRLGVKLSYSIEPHPLGTAGSVKNCRDFYGDEDFLVISADAACDFKLCELYEAHKSSHADATLALCRTSVPLSYGLAVTDENDRIRAFIEKPDWTRVVTDLVNTGIYVLSPRAMEYVPPDQPCDFGHELFPRLLSEGRLLLGLCPEGYWCDVGTPLSYYRCCADALEGKLRLHPDPAFIPHDEKSDSRSNDEAGLILPCRDRAALMRSLSGLMLEVNADYSDGILVAAPNFLLRIAPCSSRSALSFSVRSNDAEFSRELALSAKAVAEALENGLQNN